MLACPTSKLGPERDHPVRRRGAAGEAESRAVKRDTGKTLYILDEPTTGLHFADIQQLLDVLHRLRDHGNTVVVIEHNLDVIKTADWLVEIIAVGTHPGNRRNGAVAHRLLPQTAAGA